MNTIIFAISPDIACFTGCQLSLYSFINTVNYLTFNVTVKIVFKYRHDMISDCANLASVSNTSDAFYNVKLVLNVTSC